MKVITIDILFGIANVLFLVSSYPMIKAAVVNKRTLKGFSFSGSLLTSIGMIVTIISFIYIHTYISALLAIPTTIYWIIVSYYNRPILSE